MCCQFNKGIVGRDACSISIALSFLAFPPFILKFPKEKDDGVGLIITDTCTMVLLQGLVT